VLTDQKNPLANKLDGILLPATTNFNSAGTLDLDSLRFNLGKWLATGIKGLVLLGSTGERVHLDEREYLKVIERARKDLPKERAFIVGAGQQSTLGTINEIRNAAHAGADAVLVITPHFYHSAITQQTLIEYYTAVGDASPVPVLLYSMPALTGIKIEPATVAHLSAHPNIVGVKDSSNDMVGFREIVNLCPTEFAVLTGNGTVLLDALKNGATGGILAVGCAVPEICLEIFRSFKASHLDRAELLQAKLTPFATAVTTRFGIGGLKSALDLTGYRGGTVRAPLRTPEDDQRAEIETLLEELRATFRDVTVPETSSQRGTKY
jgi:4-hydroxy-2-oxoglutarate aldolase